MKEEIIKVAIPDDWDLDDTLKLRNYYKAIERIYKEYEILGFIKYKDDTTKVILKKC